MKFIRDLNVLEKLDPTDRRVVVESDDGEHRNGLCIGIFRTELFVVFDGDTAYTRVYRSKLTAAEEKE